MWRANTSRGGVAGSQCDVVRNAVTRLEIHAAVLGITVIDRDLEDVPVAAVIDARERLLSIAKADVRTFVVETTSPMPGGVHSGMR